MAVHQNISELVRVKTEEMVVAYYVAKDAESLQMTVGSVDL